MSVNAVHTTDQLAELIQRRHQNLVQLREISLRQSVLIEAGDMTELINVLSVKQRSIAALQAVDRELAPYRDQDPGQRQWRSPAARAQCAQLATECERLMSEIVQREQQSEQRMTQRRDEVATRLEIVHSAARARTAYDHDPIPTTGMLDVSSDS